MFVVSELFLLGLAGYYLVSATELDQPVEVSRIVTEDRHWEVYYAGGQQREKLLGPAGLELMKEGAVAFSALGVEESYSSGSWERLARQMSVA